MNIEEKILLLIKKIFLIVGIFFIFIIGIGMIIFIHNKIFEMVRSETEFMAESIEDDLSRYRDLFISINLNGDVQNCLEGSNRYDTFLRAGRALEQIGNLNENVNFVMLFSDDGDKKQIRSGRRGLQNKFLTYEKRIREDYYVDSYSINGGLYINFTKEYNSQYSLGFYYNIYSTKQIGKSLGILYLNTEDKYFKHVMDDKQDGLFLKQTYIVHDDGTILTSNREDEIGEKLKKYNLLIDEDKFVYNINGVLAYKKISNYNMYYVVELNWSSLFFEGIGIILILIISLYFLFFVISKLIVKVINKAYSPLEDMVKAMEQVSDDGLMVRIPENTTDRDIMVIIKGYNKMMDKINELLDKVKEEDEQLMNIKLNALHSQIQPHFLYNTLDCIHWKALLSNNKDISDMVKALAGYYRICLSGGKDIINLEKEVEYLENYLYIQKVRYGDILDYRIHMEKELNKYQIPKLTLQPLIENSIYHGIKMEKNKKGHINIFIKKDDENILIEIEDNGVGMTDEEIIEINKNIVDFDKEFGYGVRNVNRRIELFYGKGYGLNYRKNRLGGVTVSIKIPCREDKKS